MNGPHAETARQPLTPEQQALVRRSAAIVNRIARDVSARYGARVPFQDLVALGQRGLVEAAATFDPSLGVAFSVFASYRVQGAMLDGIRKELSHARAVLAAARAAGCEYLAAQRDDLEATRARGEPEEAARRRLEAFSDGFVAAMFAGLVGAALRVAPEDDVVLRESYARAIAALDEATEGLPDREQKILELHYRKGRDMKEVAAALGVSYATARRHHDALLRKLATRLHAKGIRKAPPPDPER